MSELGVYVGGQKLEDTSEQIQGSYVQLEGETLYKIENFDLMPSFFMSIVSHADHWMFISSSGGLTTGRKNEHAALFPYYTDDKITDFAHKTGNLSVIRVKQEEGWCLWEPFSDRYAGLIKKTRNLYKNVSSSKLIFEEINHDLELVYRYSWQFSDKYGFVKKTHLINLGKNARRIELLDGLQNLLPYGLNSGLQNERSNLVGAYKRNELEPQSGIGLFLLSAIIVDKAEPSEAMKATSVWAKGLPIKHMLLSRRQLERFRLAKSIISEVDIKGEEGAYLITSSFELSPDETQSWLMVAEVNQKHSDIIWLKNQLINNSDGLAKEVEDDIEYDTRELKQMVAKADGLQQTQDALGVGRHFSNVLFNVMRGGIFEDQYRVDKDDLQDYISLVHKSADKEYRQFFKQFDSSILLSELLAKAGATGEKDLIRLCYEYLPLSFSRRHGDPSRPWNKFSIEINKEDGKRDRNYQGNWRDIFQNWEALALSFPDYTESMIAKFLNASTIDGYNPYRITRSGIDWEVIEPNDPWSFIGYWGDHQIIYLLKLLEISRAHHPEALSALLKKPYYVYANVPYRIVEFKDILKNPKDTIKFDEELENEIIARTNSIGSDGKLVFDHSDKLVRATLAEKILVPLLSKVTNLIPEAGIWLNTQRPEWNDANNALVGHGVSMVTLYYMRRYVTFIIKLFQDANEEKFELRKDLVDLLIELRSILHENEAALNSGFDAKQRMSFVEKAGLAGEKYRTRSYNLKHVKYATYGNFELLEFLELLLTFLNQTITANKRSDGLYNTYNLIELHQGTAQIKPLYEMLEGQVAVLASGYLSPKEALEVLDALKKSKMYRADQFSYMLYPDRDLARFLEKNTVSKEFINNSTLAKKLMAGQDESILIGDIEGEIHFNGSFNNGLDLEESLGNLGDPFKSLVKDEKQSFLDEYERIFNHQAFTGRSGTFFGYEGLGSIYWHMVSKLLMCVQENLELAHELKEDNSIIGPLTEHYYEIRAGIGINKSPDLYGAVPTDPYSHTPSHKGAQQPGMTGQVKEDVINRWAELGVNVHDGKLQFNPTFLATKEFELQSTNFDYYTIAGEWKNLIVSKGALAFTYCQIPVVYKLSKGPGIRIFMKGQDELHFEGVELPVNVSKQIFDREDTIGRIEVDVVIK